MRAKRITERFPWILPLRRKQRIFCFYLGLCLDKNKYANEHEECVLEHLMFSSSCPLINTETGFDIKYQENKVFNLKLAAKPLNMLIIRPGETFSFWKLVKDADKDTPYKDGLVVLNGELQTMQGGGLCQMSNLLFWCFLHTPMKIIERHGHRKKDFPEPPSDAPLGVDATVSEGWLDLKVKNDTNETYQIVISFEDGMIVGQIRTASKPQIQYSIQNGQLQYYRENGKIYEQVDVIQNAISVPDGKDIGSKLLYQNCCEIGYELPKETFIKEKE